MGIFILNRNLPDDMGNCYVPFTHVTTDNYGGAIGYFTYPDWFDQRYYFFTS